VTKTEWGISALTCVNDLNVLGDDIDAINKNTIVIVASKEVGLEVNVDKT
jgi:hypothetical protein